MHFIQSCNEAGSVWGTVVCSNCAVPLQLFERKRVGSICHEGANTTNLAPRACRLSKAGEFLDFNMTTMSASAAPRCCLHAGISHSSVEAEDEEDSHCNHDEDGDGDSSSHARM